MNENVKQGLKTRAVFSKRNGFGGPSYGTRNRTFRGGLLP